MHETKIRLSELVKAMEKRREMLILHRHGQPVAEIRAYLARSSHRLKTNDRLRVTLSPGYDPTEPLQPDELPKCMQ